MNESVLITSDSVHRLKDSNHSALSGLFVHPKFLDSFASQSSKSENNLRQKYNKILFDAKSTVFYDGELLEISTELCLCHLIVKSTFILTYLTFNLKFNEMYIIKNIIKCNEK